MEEQPKAAPDDALVIPLTTPVSIGPQVFTELRFPPKLKGKHLRRFGATTTGSLDLDLCFKVAADCCGVPDRVFDEMDAKDAAGIYTVMVGFLARAGFLGSTSPA